MRKSTLIIIVQSPDFTQSFNRYSYCLNNPLKYNDPSGEFWGLLAAWFGNYAINWLDNTINKGMSPKQAFQQTPIMFSGNFSPSNQTFSHPQVDAQKSVAHLENYSKDLDRQIASFSGMGREKTLPLNLSYFSTAISIIGEGLIAFGDYESQQLYNLGFRKGINGNYLLEGRNLNLFKNQSMSSTTKPLSQYSKIGSGFRMFGTSLAISSQT